MAKRQPEAPVPLPWKKGAGYVFHALAAGGLLVGAIIAFQKLERFLISNPRFTLHAPEEYGELSPDIRVEGAVYSSAARLRNIFAQDTGRSLYLFPLAERRRSLLAVDWVKEASVSRIWPNKVRVRIVERQPAAFVRFTGSGPETPSQIALIDEDGVILELPPRARYKLPVLTGIQREMSEALRRERVKRMLRMMRELGVLGEKISEIDLSDVDNVKVTQQMGGTAVVLMLGQENFLARFQMFLKYYPEIRKRMPNATTLDLRLDDRITAVGGETDAR